MSLPWWCVLYCCGDASFFSSIVPHISVIGLEVGWFTGAVMVGSLCSTCNRSDESGWPLWPGINGCRALLLVGGLWDRRPWPGQLAGPCSAFKGHSSLNIIETLLAVWPLAVAWRGAGQLHSAATNYACNYYWHRLDSAILPLLWFRCVGLVAVERVVGFVLVLRWCLAYWSTNHGVMHQEGIGVTTRALVTCCISID
jgi:hypothetical protein